MSVVRVGCTVAIAVLTAMSCTPDAPPRAGTASSKPPAGAGSSATSAPSRRVAPASKPTQASDTLKVSDLSFAGAAGHRDDATFGRGEELVALLSVRGFIYRDGRARILGDLDVSGEDGTVVLRSRALPLLVGKAPTKRPGQLRAAARVTLDAGLPAGRYRLRVDVRDELSRRRGHVEGTFKLLSPTLPRAATFAVLGLRTVGDRAVPAGSVLPLAFTAAGLAPRRDTQGEVQLELGLKSEIIDAAGKVRATDQRRALRRALLFAPTSYPLRLALVVPSTLPLGKYRARLTLEDRRAKQKARAELPFEIIARRFAIVSPHLHDAGGLPRRRFRFGEQAFLRFSLQGFATRAERAHTTVDLAVAGPGGIYLAGKNAAELSGLRSASAARSGRFPVQLPLRLPALAPAGSYQVLLRARDLFAKRSIERSLRFALEGEAPKPLGSFAVDKLYVRERADLPRIKGDTFVSGRSYQLTVRAGGGRLKPIKRATYALEIRGTLRLRTVGGRVVGSWKDLFHYKRTLHYQPLRVLLPATWTVPAGLPRALYDLEIELLLPARQRVSTLRKRIEILGR